MPKLLIATKNAHKTAEIAAMLPGWEVSDLTAQPEIAAPEETGATFAENAAIKAVAASLRFEGLVLSDDSGLEVDALGGAPGVVSARYAGPDASDADNRARLLRELAADGARGKARSARFRCVMTLAERGMVLGTFDGTVEGTIINAERGSGGFGYDSLFVPQGYCETFAQLPPSVKNQLSHRARALAKATVALDRRATGPYSPGGS
jgi:XTP/dITP diphosphohydrolase